MLSKDAKDKIGMTFGFSLCIVLLSVVLIIYSRRGLERTWKVGVLEGDEVYYCQH